MSPTEAQAAIIAARADLRTALLSGTNTASIRRRLAEVERAAATATAEAAEHRAAAEAAEAMEVRTSANSLENAAVDGLTAMLARLKPSNMPALPGRES
jgi:hypothetical protein